MTHTLRMLDDFRITGCDLLLKCPRCRREVKLPLTQAIEDWGGNFSLLKMHWKLCCKSCQAQGHVVRPLPITIWHPGRIPIQGAFGGVYND